MQLSAQPFFKTELMNSVAELYHNHIRGHRVTTDSRQIQPGDIFIALRGENFDGNLYARQALEQGAALAIIDHPDCQDEHTVLVSDTLTFLQELAHYHRHQLNIPILGITGTNGKTTTKELCHAVLSAQFKTQATQGNLNNHIGVPLTLLSMDETTEIGIVEMGANHPGEIKTLCDIADPDLGIITNIGQAHLEGFGSYENIIETKTALYRHVQAKNGKLFVHAEDPLLMRLTTGTQRYTYGQQGDFLKGEVKQTIPYLVYALKTLKGDLYVKTHLVGGYNFANAMAASAAGFYFGIDPLLIQKAIEGYHPSNLRSQLLKTGQNTIILDAYNANPSSMQAALGNFIEMPGERKTVILGEMRELGASSEKAHQDLVQQALQGNFEQIFLIGDNFEHCSDNLTFITWLKDTEALIAYLKSHPLSGRFIFVKGSRGNQLERIVEYL